MNRIHALVIGLTAVAAVAADKQGKFDADKVVGTWTLIGGTKDGAKMDKALGDVVFTKDKISLTNDGMKFEFSYKLDPKTDPAPIEMEILAPEAFKGAKAKGIITVEGDALKLAYHPMGGERPKDFDAKKGTGEFSFTHKKAEKK